MNLEQMSWIAAIIAVPLMVLTWLFKPNFILRKKNKKTNKPNFDLKIEPVQPKSNLPTKRRITDLSHKQISDAIKAVPPLQQDSIEASFVGVFVRWRGKLFGATRITDHVLVSLDDICKEGGLVHCTAAIEDCVDLIIAPSGTELIVQGQIKRVDEHRVELDNCTFEMPQKSDKPDSYDSDKQFHPDDGTQKRFTAMVDYIKSQKPPGTHNAISDYWKSCQPVEAVSALIKFSNEIQTEDELKWYCGEFEKHGYAHPLKLNQSVLGDGFQWLPVLKEARHRPQEIKSEVQFIDFLGVSWSGKEKWKAAMQIINAPLVIHSADWWIEDKHSDVTKIVRQYLIESKTPMPCEISILRDPRAGISKLLTIDYSIGGKRLKKTFKEHDTISPHDLK